MSDDPRPIRTSGSLPALEDLQRALEQDLERTLKHAADGGLAAEEVKAAARELAWGRALPEASARFFRERPALTLVSFDADRIQSWVFASERIQVASGASKTLETLNDEVSRHPTRIPGVQGLVFSAGGGGMLLAEPAATQGEMETLTGGVRSWLESRAPELTFTVVGETVRADQLAPGGEPRPLPENAPAGLGRFAIAEGLHGTLVRMQVKVRQEKEARPRLSRGTGQLQSKRGTAAERCPSCRRHPPPKDKTPVTSDDPEFWCTWCHSMRRKAREGFARDRDPFSRDGKPLTFGDLAEASAARRRPYLAFLAADGNGMGSLVQGLGSFLQLRAFSVTTSAVYEAARNCVSEVLALGYLAEGWDPEDSYLSLLSGGDEITLVLPAAPAPRIALEVGRIVEEGFDQATRPGGLLHRALGERHPVLARAKRAGSGLGLVAAQSTYPVRLLRHYAERLQRQAKRGCAGGGSRSALAWTLLTDVSPLPQGMESDDLTDLRLEDFEELLLEAVEAKRQGLPRSALERLVAFQRREEADCAHLGACRGEVVTALSANFLRYQLARNAKLSAWWKGIIRATASGDGDPVLTWLRRGEGRHLETLLDLLSLQPYPAHQAMGDRP